METRVNRGAFEVMGRTPLHGEIAPQGNKNEAMPALAACLLTEEPVILENLPAIEDVEVMKDILRAMGGSIEEVEPGDSSRLRVQFARKPNTVIPADLMAKLRGAVTLAGPLLGRCGHVFLPRPGGDRIGRRRLDTHMLALQQLGGKIQSSENGFDIRARKLIGCDMLLDEASVTGTENAICAAVLAKGTTIIRNAASEPHVQGLCHLLNKMGARIRGIGSNILEVEGVKSLHGATHRIGPDYLEVGSFIALGAVTRGELIIHDADLPNLRMIRLVFARLGIQTVADRDRLIVPKKQSRRIQADLGGAIPKIEDAPWPAFPADMTSVALVTATQCRGTILIHEKMFESRLYFTDPLIGMGAAIVLCDPHRAVVIGPSPLKASRLVSPDIRAGMAMLIAALCAEGTSTIENIGQIDRGFSRIEERLQKLGARIRRV